MTHYKLLTWAVLMIIATGCSDDLNNGVDTKELDTFRKAIPNYDALAAQAPEPNTQTPNALVGDDALLPPLTIGIAVEINTHLQALLSALHSITDTPPTFFDSEAREYLWGPFNNDDTELKDDTVAVYIRDNGVSIGLEDDDLRFQYALLRGMSRNLSTMEPVIWGGHTPNPDDNNYGQGVVLYDLEANLAWEAQHNPTKMDLPEGRFAVVYVKQRESTMDNSTLDADLSIVMGAFRNFVPGPEDWEAPSVKPEAIDAEYLWGGFAADAGDTFAFIDVGVVGNVFPFENPASSSNNEDFGILAAFTTTGLGTGRMQVHGQDVVDEHGADQFLEATECWNNLLERDYFIVESVNQMDSTDRSELASEGDAEQCAEGLILAEIPSLEGLQEDGADLLQALIDLSENGVPNE